MPGPAWAMHAGGARLDGSAAAQASGAPMRLVPQYAFLSGDLPCHWRAGALNTLVAPPTSRRDSSARRRRLEHQVIVSGSGLLHRIATLSWRHAGRGGAHRPLDQPSSCHRHPPRAAAGEPPAQPPLRHATSDPSAPISPPPRCTPSTDLRPLTARAPPVPATHSGLCACALVTPLRPRIWMWR